MNRLPDFQTDLLFSETPPAPAEAAKAADTQAEPAGTDHGNTHEATTTQPAPLAPQAKGILPEPISGGQTTLLVLFGLLAFVMLVAMTRFGSENNYGD